MTRGTRSSMLLRALALAIVASPLYSGQPIAWVMGRTMQPCLDHPSRSGAASLTARHAGKGTDGPFTPLVKGARTVLGEEKLNQVRGEAIKAHTKVIQKFVGTSDSEFGKIALRQLFEAADADTSGKLDKHEIRTALKKLGFYWMDNEDKVAKVLLKGDKDGDELIDLEEFRQTAPIVLQQNLIKLAKQNGNNLGFLS